MKLVISALAYWSGLF